MPMVLSLMLCTVTFPVVAQAMADGDTRAGPPPGRARSRAGRRRRAAGRRVRDRLRARRSSNSSSSAARSTARDTAATAAVMRVYALGLLGHTLVGALSARSSPAPGPPGIPAARDGRRARSSPSSPGRSPCGPWGVSRHRRRQRRRHHHHRRSCCCRAGRPGGRHPTSARVARRARPGCCRRPPRRPRAGWIAARWSPTRWPRRWPSAACSCPPAIRSGASAALRHVTGSPSQSSALPSAPLRQAPEVPHAR